LDNAHPPPPRRKGRFPLLDEQSDDPIVAAELATPTRGGIYAIDLAKHGVKLETGKEYEWSVALACDPKDSAKDGVARGGIGRVPWGEPVASGTSDAVRRLAEQGLWYDALAEVEGMMKTQPDDASEMRSALLRQVGLEAVAAAL